MPLLRFLLLLLAGLLVGTPALAQSFPPLTGRVVDDAHVLTADQVAQLTARSAEIEQASSRQFVVATIPDLQGDTIEEFGYKLGRAWKIGQKDANNGIILIVAPKEHKVRIEVGRGLEPIMTDALSSVIINQTIVPKFKAGDMGGGVVAGADAIAEQMKLPLEAAEQRSAKILATQQQTRQSEGDLGVAAVPIILVVLVVAFVGLSFVRRGAGGQRYTGVGGGGGGNGIGSTVANVALWSVLDGLSNRDRGGSWGGGSSGWGGGGSSDGGGFSGGGGDFGGGGASGDW